MRDTDLIDPLLFAGNRQKISGSLGLNELDARVSSHEYLFDASSNCQYQVVGSQDELGRDMLQIEIQTCLNLICQRCLKEMVFPVEKTSRIILFTDDSALDKAMAEDDDLEGMLVVPQVSIKTLIEDEILIALPLAPRHERCTHPQLEKINRDKPNPFALLVDL